jgi:hypothetical protein
MRNAQRSSTSDLEPPRTSSERASDLVLSQAQLHLRTDARRQQVQLKQQQPHQPTLANTNNNNNNKAKRDWRGWGPLAATGDWGGSQSQSQLCDLSNK